MPVFEKLSQWVAPPFPIWSVQLPEHEIRLATGAAALFNLMGMPVELIVMRGFTDMPRWPEYVSIAVGAVIFLLLLFDKLRGRPNLVQVLFVINAAAVSFALWVVYSYFGTSYYNAMPFQATKLGALVAGLLAPSFFVGIAAI